MRIAFFLLLLTKGYHVLSQTDSLKNYSFGVNYLGGKMYIHTPKIYLQAPPYSQALEFSFNKQTLGNAYWQQRFGFPETGLSFSMAHYGDAKIGMAFGLYPSIQFRILNFKNSYWYFKVGGGIGIATKSWNRVPYEDSANNIVGSTLNNFTMIQSGFRMRVAPKWSLQGGIHFFHVSNAGARKPNFGINTLGASLGVNYHPKGFVNQFQKKQQRPYRNPLNIVLQTTCAFAEDKTADGPIYPAYNVSGRVTKMYRGKSRAALGADATYNSRLYAQYKNSFQYSGKERANAWIYSIFAGHEFVFGKIGLPMQLGYYLNKPNEGYPIYQKLGINYHFFQRQKSWIKDLYITTLLKTHFATAEYAELGIGVML